MNGFGKPIESDNQVLALEIKQMQTGEAQDRQEAKKEGGAEITPEDLTAINKKEAAGFKQTMAELLNNIKLDQ